MSGERRRSHGEEIRLLSQKFDLFLDEYRRDRVVQLPMCAGHGRRISRLEHWRTGSLVAGVAFAIWLEKKFGIKIPGVTP
jgi:hypothetical protein